ncbi:MAG: SDR family NAD(P)-dependent oxidoreductase [Gammaproteobacteria bacterium]|nr:SDR family NAD(P)-dependent oxidoreductase [Gammaproteobacteria bacterium]
MSCEIHRDRTFLVTGASSGIGRAVTMMLLQRSAKVVGVSRRALIFTAAEVDAVDTDNFRSIQCDLSDFESLSELLEPEVKRISADVSYPLIGVALCHGYGDFGSVEQFSNERISRLINTNLTSHIMIARLILPVLKTAGSGDLVFIGSESSLKGGKKGAIYCATKFGLRGFVQSLRPECASANVRIGIVNPGMVDTDFFNHLDFTPGEVRDNRLHAETVANAVMSIFEMPQGAVMDEVSLSPLKTVIRNK